MNNYFITLTGSIYFLFMGMLCQAQQMETLTIGASNFESTKGAAIAHLFREHDDIPETPFLQATSTIVNGSATIVFLNIPYGEYAVILFHDENSNSTLDHKFGFPNEPMGFSNEWKLSLFSGMPTFNKLKFSFTEKGRIQAVKLK